MNTKLRVLLSTIAGILAVPLMVWGANVIIHNSTGLGVYLNGELVKQAITVSNSVYSTSFNDFDITDVGDVALDTISADGSSFSISDDWTNAGNTIADLGIVTTVDINGGTVTGITDLLVEDGGTGAGSFTDGGILLGSDTGALTAMAVLADGSIIVGDGTTDPVALAAFSSSTGDLTMAAGGTGASLVNDPGGVLYCSASVIAVLADGTAGKFLQSAGTSAPTWEKVDLGAETDITGTLAVGNGGTGATSFTDGGVLLGSDTGAITALGVLADGSIIVGDGTTDPVALAAFSSSTGDLNVAAGGTGVSALTDHCVFVGSGTDAVTILSVGGANEVLCGAAGADPGFRSLVDDDIPADISLVSSVINNAGGGSIAVPEKTPVNAVASEGTLTSDTTAPSDGETVTIDEKVYTFKTTLTPTEGEVLIGVSAAVALDNLLSAINHTGTPDTDYKCAAVHPTVTATTNTDTTQVIQAKTKGVAGDTIVFSETSAHLSVDAATLGTTVAGVDGTVGVANETCADASYLYHSVAANTIADDNWRRVSLGSAY